MKIYSYIILPIFIGLAAFPFSCASSKNAGIYISFDNGENWAQKGYIDKKHNLNKFNILSIKSDPLDPKIVYAGTSGSGIFKSTDSGDSWTRMIDQKKILVGSLSIYNIEIDQDNHVLYLSASYNNRCHFLKSTDDGDNFEELYTCAKDGSSINVIDFNPLDYSDIYIGTSEGGLLESNDFGKTWRPIKWFDSSLIDVKIDPFDPQIICAVTQNNKVYKTIDKGNNWQSLQGFDSLDKMKNIFSIEFDKQNRNVIYLISNNAIAKTLDGGQTWQAVNIIIPKKYAAISCFAIDSKNSLNIYYGAGAKFYITRDGGETWSVREIKKVQNIQTIAIDPQNSNKIFIGMHQ